ncbi:MAG TPA: FtsX-like permease family protein, partial [Ktedonobacterales bacterium]|nr:FtsX-like permease family protein [Ktedonobacterales bacterium]
MGGSATSDIATDEPRESPNATARDRVLWRGWAGPRSLLTVALVWLRRSGSFLVPMALGVLVTAVLLCTVPLYLLLTSDAQLQYLLATTPKPDINIEAQVALASVAATDVDGVVASAQGLGSVYLRGFAPTSMSFLDAGDMSFTSVNGAPLDSGPNPIHAKLATAEGRPTAFYFAQAGPHMRLYAGRLPRDVGPNQMPEVLATPKLDVQVGDIIGLKQLGRPDTDMRARVVGIWFPKDQSDPFWNGHSYDTVNNCGLVCPPDIYPLLFTHDGFFQAIATFKEPSPQNFNTNLYFVNVHEVYFTQPSRLHVSDIPTTLDLIGSYIRDIDYSTSRTHSVFVITRLDTLLATLNRAQSLGSLPLYIVVAQIAILIFLFIFTVAALVIEEREGVIATLKSRGASRTQLLLSFGLLAVVPAALMAAVGALLASWAAVELILTLDPLAASVVGAAYYAAVASPHAAMTPALIAAALGMLAVVAAAWLATRGGLLAYRQERGRASRAPFWKRYYLDIVLAILCLAGYVELSQFGGFSIRSQLGITTTGADPLQVAAPALLALSGALILLRALSPVARLCARIAMRGRGAPRMLAFTQAARASGHFALVTLLVTLAVAFGFFALTYQSVLVRNAAERAAYAAGGDETMTLDNSMQGTPYVEIFQSHIGGLPGVEAATPIVRSPAKATPDLGNGTVGMLGIDPATFARVAYWRSDYANQSLPSLLDQMHSHEQGEQ